MSIGIAYNPCKNCKEMDKCSICELTYYRKGYIKFLQQRKPRRLLRKGEKTRNDNNI